MRLPLGKGSIELSLLAGQTLRVLPTLLTSEFGQFRASGSWDFNGSMDFLANYETQALGKWAGALFPAAQALLGPLAIQARALGDAAVPDVSLVAHSAQLFWQDKSLGPVRMEGRLLGRELMLLGSPARGIHLSAGMTLREPYAYHLSSAVELSGISFDLPMSTSIKARLKAKGELNNPRALMADADIELLRLSREGFSVSNRSPVQLTDADEKLKLSFLQMEGPNTTLLAQGVLGLKDSNFSIYGTFDLRLLETLLPGIEGSAGEVGITAVVGGGLLNPSIAGVAELNQAQAMLKAWPVALEQMNAQIEFSNQRVWIHDARALANGGQVQAQGALSWSLEGLEDVGIEGQFQKVNLEVLPGTPGVFSGNFQMEGTQRLLTLSGLVEAEKFRYEKPLVLEDFIKQVGVRSYGDAKPSEEWLKYDITLRAGDVRIDNNLARARLLGQVRLTGSNVQPDFYGSIETAPGGEAYFRGNTFGVQRGLLQLSGRANSLQLVAQSQIQEYLVLVRASGDLSNPKVVLSSEPSLTEADILSVLTMGTTAGEQSTSSAGVSLMAQAFFSVSGLERWLQDLFSGSALLQGQQMQFATSLNEATGVTEPSVRWESKLLSEQFRLGVVQPLTGRGTKVQAEWRFNERVSLRTQWDNWNQGFSFGNFGSLGFDLKFRFEWE
jgi:translocation and assembly module TamB